MPKLMAMRVLDLILSRPGITTRELAMEVYGASCKRSAMTEVATATRVMADLGLVVREPTTLGPGYSGHRHRAGVSQVVPRC